MSSSENKLSCDQYHHYSYICLFSNHMTKQDKGAELLRKLSFDSIDSDHLERYTFLASSYCLLKYLEKTANVCFPPNSLKIDFSYGYGGRLVIDSKVRQKEMN